MKKWVCLALLLGGATGAQGVRACGGTPGFPAWFHGGLYNGLIGTRPVNMHLDRADTGTSEAERLFL